MGKEQRSSSSAAMCTLEKHHNNRQGDVRAPLRSIPAQATPAFPTAPTTQGGTNTSGLHWPFSPTKLPGNHEATNEAAVAPVESFELEDNTTGSGGTSWTLRVPWLRNKRPRRQRQDDENSSIQTVQSRSTVKLVAPGTDDPLLSPEGVYYGGLMKTASPTFVSVEAGNIEALEGDGLVLDSPRSSTRVLQQQRQSLRHNKSLSNKHKRRHSNRKGSHKAARAATPEMDQNLFPQHTPPPPPPPPAPPVAKAVTAPESGALRQYFLSNTPRLEPKNNNKVFRNRSWISTSSRESEGRRHRRQNGSEEDSLADFDEAEWTPQDSAYGAAIPVCGWVPKQLRQGIEATLIALTVFALVYWVVTTSISVSEGKGDGTHMSYNDTYVNSGVNGYDNGLEFDDDWYVEFSQMQNDEDDYFNNDNKDRGNEGNHGG